jgi:hypothetical protein
MSTSIGWQEGKKIHDQKGTLLLCQGRGSQTNRMPSKSTMTPLAYQTARL